jgi:hypothetical protein
MKNLLTIVLGSFGILFLTQTASAQTVGQGAWMVGGAAALDITKYKDADESITSFVLNPNLGYFFADDLAIGLELAVVDNGIEWQDALFAVGPFVRYYVTDPIFIEVGANFSLNDGGGTGFGASVGYSWFLNDGIAIEPALYFQSVGNDGDAFDYTSFGLSIGVQGFANHTHGME